MQHPIDPFSCVLSLSLSLATAQICCHASFACRELPCPSGVFLSPSARSHFYPNIDVTSATRKRPQLSTRNPFRQ
ncbi:hypothetical protein CTAM01_09110 [Colletotrichum tamarilloi]|uniref:Secreted protein n=1 Tax=Colletotrichum tamarilloi TaxID=1209934 RepID=A0ABQ9R4D3_9PEZI|nr:uncharacterized protein CTAM01_09110 [Colletotrichum tamarilloi]KAK1494229.1 hypothetical protein CTAM01_09110 [Colletotrichum tamarilloi]